MGEQRKVLAIVPSQKALLGKSNTKGTPQVEVDFEVTDGPEDGATLKHFMYLSDAAIQYTVKDLRTLGWKGDDVSNITGLDRKVELVLEPEEYKGQTRDKVKFINDPTDRPGSQGIDNPGAFAASLKGKIAQADRNIAEAKNGKAGAVRADDNVPF